MEDRMLRPTTETELSEAVRDADGTLRIVGGDTRGMAPVEGTTLSVAGLSGITLYDPGALTLVAKAGTPVAEIEAALAAEHQMLAFEPMDHRRLLGREGTPTIGGVMAANVSGPRRVSVVAACRDAALGIRFVDGRGTVVKNGGRVMKNVTGYDLVKLMAGSHGTLGVLSEVALKVLPRPETQATLRFEGLGDRDALALLSAAMGSPFEVTGAACDPGAGYTWLRLEGFADSVAYRRKALADRLSRYGTAAVVEADESEALWHDVRDCAAFADRSGDVWRLSVRPSDGPGIAERLGLPVLSDWAGGLIWVLCEEGLDLRAELDDLRGHATRVRGSGTAPRFHPEPAPVAALSAGLRARFDPRGILNPGLMG